MVNRMTLKVNLPIRNDEWKPGLPLINDPKYGLSKRSNDEKIMILNDFSEFLADRMAMLIKKRIYTQYKYLKYKWEPLTPGYAAFKKQVGLAPGIWEATGFLVKSITSYKEGESFIVGIDPGLRYPDSKTNVLFVAKCMEFGTRYMPARPLFGPTVVFMRRHIREYWESFLEKSLDIVGGVDYAL